MTVCGRPLPGGGRHQPQHEHQRGDRQPGHPDPGRQSRANTASTPTTTSTCRSRPTTPSPPPSAWAACGGWMSCWQPWMGWQRAAPESPRIRRYRQIGPHPPARCRAGAPGPGVWRLCPRRRTRRERIAAPPKGCAAWALAAPPPAGAERPPRISPPHGARLSNLTGLELYESDNLFESMQSMADAPISRPPAHPGDHPDPHRQRFPPAGLWPGHRAG
jgi:hypothetical protein